MTNRNTANLEYSPDWTEGKTNSWIDKFKMLQVSVISLRDKTEQFLFILTSLLQVFSQLNLNRNKLEVESMLFIKVIDYGA